MKLSRCLLPALLAGAVSMTATPAQAGFVDGVGVYVQDRINDFADIFRIRAGVPNSGRSLGFKVRATTLAQVGYVHFDGDYWGMDRRSIGKVDEVRTEGGVSLFYGSNTEMVPMLGNIFLMGDSEWSDIQERTLVRYLASWDDGRKRPFSLGLEIALPVVALDLGLYPTEAFDFALGFTTIDLYKDDRLYQPTLRPEAPAVVPPRPDNSAPFRDVQERFEHLREHFKQMELEEQMEEFSRLEAQQQHEATGSLDRERMVPSTGTEGGIPRDAADALSEELERMEEQVPDADPPAGTNGEARPQATTADPEAVQRAIERQEEAVRRQQERHAREAEEAAERDAAVAESEPAEESTDE